MEYGNTNRAEKMAKILKQTGPETDANNKTGKC